MADKNNDAEVNNKKNVLYFEGAGWGDADSSKSTDLKNCRIRTRFQNNTGEEIYLELGGGAGANQGKAYIHYCFYNDCNENSSLRQYEKGSWFNYNKTDLLHFVNTKMNCSFNDIETIHDDRYRVHGENGTYNIYNDNINTQKGDHIAVNSSHGVVTIDKNGYIVEGDLIEYNIKRFDVEEYKKHYNVDQLPSTIDILDLGYWYDEIEYVEPDHQWRKEIKEELGL